MASPNRSDMQSSPSDGSSSDGINAAVIAVEDAVKNLFQYVSGTTYPNVSGTTYPSFRTHDLMPSQYFLPIGVVATMIVVIVCLLVVIMRYMYRHKGTYQTHEAKGTEFAESADEALKCHPCLLEDMEDSKTEYFI